MLAGPRKLPACLNGGLWLTSKGCRPFTPALPACLRDPAALVAQRIICVACAAAATTAAATAATVAAIGATYECLSVTW